MAKIGLKLPRYCPFTDVENETLGTGKVMSRAIKADISIETSDIKQYSDDALGESLKEFVKGTITQENDDVDLEVLSELLGHTYADDELTANGDDIAPFVRVGFIVTRIKDNVRTYRAICFLKVKYGIPNESYETKGENTAFKSSTIVGDIFRNKDGDYKKEKTFTKQAEAITYLNELVNYTVTQ